MEEEARRIHRGGVMKKESWSGESALTRQPVGGSWEEAARREQPYI